MLLNFIEDWEFDYNPFNVIYDRICLEVENEILVFKLKFDNNDLYNAIENYIKEYDDKELVLLDKNTIKETYKVTPKILPCLFSLRKNEISLNPKFFVPPLTEILGKLITLYTNDYNNSISHHDFCLLYYLYKQEENKLGGNIIKELFSNVNMFLRVRLNKSDLEEEINSNNQIDKRLYKRFKYFVESASENKQIFEELGLNSKLEDDYTFQKKR